MIIGIVSDSHDDMAQIEKAVEFFNSEGVEHVLHAGDLISPFTFEVFGDLTCPFTGIFGNNDGDRVLLRGKSGDKVHAQPLTLTLDGKKIIIVHEPIAANALAASGHFDVVIYGHTHEPDIRKEGDTIIINPGKLARLHKGTSTVAFLDTKTMEARTIDL
jgi:putative phosphoesterase